MLVVYQSLTSLGMGVLSMSAALRLSTQVLSMVKRVSAVCDPQWGVSSTWSHDLSGWPGGSGSGSVTSRAAPRICFVLRASSRALWSSTAPAYNKHTSVTVLWIDTSGGGGMNEAPRGPLWVAGHQTDVKCRSPDPAVTLVPVN